MALRLDRTRSDEDEHYRALRGPQAPQRLRRPSERLVGTGVGSAAVVAVAVGQMGVEPRDAGTAGALNNVSQQPLDEIVSGLI